jgi:hypothetical protein
VRRLIERAQTTPGQLSLITVIVVALGLASGVAAWLAAVQRAELVHDMTVRSSPLGVSAVDIYRSLSDADATVANAFISGGTQSPALRARYVDDLSRASAALVVASHNLPGGDAAEELTVLSTQVPVYAGLVETAWAISRQGFPLGAAYLREASGLMRNTLLPAAQRLYESEKVQFAQAVDRSTAIPRVAVGLAGLTILALFVVQAYLIRRTNRVFNIGLVLATVAALGGISWLGLASAAAARHVDTGHRRGLEQAQVLAEARIAALQARADESLTLVARGSGQDFENDFTNAIDHLDGLLVRAAGGAPDPARRAGIDGIREDVRVWRQTHVQLRAYDDGGLYPDAVELATGTAATDMPVVFGNVDDALDREIGLHNGLFAREAAAGAGDLAGSDTGVAVLTLVLVSGVTLGIQRRIAEYR